MRYLVADPFTIETQQGNITIPTGRILELSLFQADQLGGKVRPADEQATQAEAIPTSKVWPPVPRAWLTESGGLRTQGVFDDLAGEIIELTANDLLLQAKLLRECCGAYSGPQWKRLVEVWQERAAIMEFDCGLSRDDAEYQAAVLLRCAAFLPELRNNLI